VQNTHLTLKYQDVFVSWYAATCNYFVRLLLNLFLLIKTNIISDITHGICRLWRAMSIISPGKIRTIWKLTLRYWSCISLILTSTIVISHVRFC